MIVYIKENLFKKKSFSFVPGIIRLYIFMRMVLLKVDLSSELCSRERRFKRVSGILPAIKKLIAVP
jgi:uncharacterized membrane protein